MVNRVLREDKVWRAVLTDLNLNHGTVLPTFSENLLYGVMSDRVHNPDLSASAFLIQFKKRVRNTTRYFELIE